MVQLQRGPVAEAAGHHARQLHRNEEKRAHENSEAQHRKPGLVAGAAGHGDPPDERAADDAEVVDDPGEGRGGEVAVGLEDAGGERAEDGEDHHRGEEAGVGGALGHLLGPELLSEARRDNHHQPGREDHDQRHSDQGAEAEEGEDGVRGAPTFLFLVAPQVAREHRNHRRAHRPAGQEIVEEIRHHEGGPVGVGVGGVSPEMPDGTVAHPPQETAEESRDHHDARPGNDGLAFHTGDYSRPGEGLAR